MATRTIQIDDLDGSEDATTVRFAVAGTEYEIDLSEDNIEQLHKALEVYTSAGRIVSGGRTRSRQPAAPRGGSGNLEVVREWARANGHKVGSKGRISKAVQDAYDEANG